MRAQANTAYVQKLVTVPDLEAEKARALKLKAEAKAEAASNPARAAELTVMADRRLEAIAREEQARARLAAGTLGPAAVKQREADAAAVRVRAVETSRLDGVKQSYVKGLEGRSPRDLRAEQQSEHERLGDAQHAVSVAREQLAAAKTPAQRSAAAQVLASAERSLRTEYAKAAAIDNVAPVTLNHQELHDYADSLKPRSLEQLKAERAKVQARFDAESGGAIRASRPARELDKVKLAILDQAIAKKSGGVGPVSKVDPTRNPGNTVFDGNGMMVANASAIDPAALAAKCKAAGVSYVMLQINNPGPVEGNIAALENGWADRLREQGIKVGFWGVSYGGGAAAADARTAAQLTAKYRGDFYVADCEGAFQDGQGDVRENRAFAEAFQDEATKLGIGKIPRALSSMGRVALDMKPWIDGGWDAMPQAYWNSYEHYQPSKCVQFYQDWGWPKDRIHPTIATYDGSGEGNARPKSIAEYDADLATTGTHGFSYYLPESYLDEAGWNAIGAAIANG